ncbi:MAG: hypothetical protein CMD23_05450 [Flavobacteriales bacterium]|nr:hypothetical protein [Flavobacteriales bacterium]|tara:strand:+ start:4112 stop:4876 length:765 start_codon:yes stop_codon:yes gene_type:complete
MYQSIIDKHNLISLDEESHTYTLRGSNAIFTSVTQFISNFFEPFDEYEIAKKLTKHPKYQGKNIEDILLDWKQRRDRGTVVHKQIENFIINMKNQYETNTNETLDLKSKQGIQFLKESYYQKPDKKNTHLIFPEVKIISEKLKLAGTIDLLIYNKNKNQISLVDWKTNKEIKTSENAYRHGIKGTPAEKIYDCSFERYSLQLSMYKHLLENYYHISVNGLYIVHLKETEFKVMPCQCQSIHIINMLQYTQLEKK